MESFSLTWLTTSTLLKKIRLYRKCFLKIFFQWLFKLLVPFYLCTLPWTILVLYFSHQSSNHIWCSHKGQLLKKNIIIKKCFNIWKELILHYDTILRKCLRGIFWWILQAADLIWLPLGEKFPYTEFFPIHIFLYSDWIQENTDQKKLRIWTLCEKWTPFLATVYSLTLGVH